MDDEVITIEDDHSEDIIETQSIDFEPVLKEFNNLYDILLVQNIILFSILIFLSLSYVFRRFK